MALCKEMQNAKLVMPPRKTNLRERVAVVGPTRLREQLLCQRTKVRNQAESVLHQGFYRAQSMKKGTDMRAVPIEGML